MDEYMAMTVFCKICRLVMVQCDEGWVCHACDRVAQTRDGNNHTDDRKEHVDESSRGKSNTTAFTG